MRFDRAVEIIAIVVLAMILIGEVITYTTGQDKYHTDASIDGDTLSYEIRVNGSETYSILVLDNGDMASMNEVYIYYDEAYASNYNDVKVAIGAKKLDQRYYIDQLIKQLEYRSAIKTTILDADGLKRSLEADIANGQCSKGLICISGALPDTVYDGDSANAIFQWMGDGGRLYWLGNLIGAQYATKDSLVNVDGHQTMFLGVDCLNMADGLKGAKMNDDTFRSSLSLASNSLRFAANVDPLIATKGVNSTLAFGYSNEGYATFVMTSYGKGMVCVIGGDYSNDQRNDLAQVLSSQICHKTKILETINGSIVRNTISGDYEIDGPTGNIAAYLYLGKDFPVHGNFFSFEA